jgi:hypothetical protein
MSWFDALYGKAENWTYDWLGKEQLPAGGADPVDIVPDQGYLTVTLRALRLAYKRLTWQTYRVAVYSRSTLPQRGSRTAPEFRQVVAASAEFTAAAHPDRVIIRNQNLLGPLPFRAAPLLLEAGLVAIKTTDLLKPYLSLLTSLSGTADVSLFGSVSTYAGLLASGVEDLIGLKNETRMEVAIQDQFNPVKAGWWAAIGAPKSEIDLKNLKVGTDNELMTEDGKPFEKYSYMVIEVHHGTRQDRWFEIPDLMQAHEELNLLVVERAAPADLKATLEVFRLKAMTSPALIQTDAAKLYEKVKAEAEAASKTQLTSAAPEKAQGLRTFKDLNLYDDKAV